MVGNQRNLQRETLFDASHARASRLEYIADVKPGFAKKTLKKDSSSSSGASDASQGNVLVLSDMPEISVRSCSAKSAAAVLVFTGNLSSQAVSLVRVGDIINGGLNWGCISADGVPGAFFWRVDGIDAVKRNETMKSTEMTIRFTQVPATEIFDSLYFRMEDDPTVKSVQSPVAQPAPAAAGQIAVPVVEPRHVATVGGKKRDVQGLITIAEPFANAIYQTGDLIVVDFNSTYSGLHTVIIYQDITG